MSSDGVFRVIPDSIYFRELAVGETDVADFWITNTSKIPRRFRCSIPRDSPFLLSNEGTILLAPGLESKVSLSYTAKNTRPYSCDLTIGCNEVTKTIAVKVTPPGARIVPDVTKISIGTIGVNLSTKFGFSMTNVGVADGKFTLECNEDISLVPEGGTISPGKSLDIMGTIKPSKIGNFELKISVDSTNSVEHVPPVILVGDAVTDDVILTVGDELVKELDFKTVFFHQKRVIRAKVINNGMHKRSFVIVPPQDHPVPSSGRSNRSARTNGTEDEFDLDAIFACAPMEGTLGPHESQEIDFVFTPPIEIMNPVDDLESIFNQYSAIEIVETNQRTDFQLSGRACVHNVSFSAVDFDFGKVEVGSKTTKTLTMKNQSPYLATEFDIKAVAQFRFLPAKGTIEPGETKEVSVLFYPKNLGNFQVTGRIAFCNNLFKKRINMIGQCGDTKEEPFKRVPVYETEEIAKYNAHHPDKRYAFGMDEIIRNTAKRKQFDAYITDSAKNRAEKRAQTELRARSRKQARSMLARTGAPVTNREVDEYIRKYTTNLDDGNEHQDIGIERYEGLTPPDPPLKKKPAPLFILHPEKFGIDKDASRGRSQTAFACRRKMHTDDNVMIKKKFKGKPTTPQEIAECNKCLTPAQQISVVASHEAINFGQVSVFSTAAKSFTISNNLQQHIIVSIDFGYDELSQSTPASQVIPPRGVAGFDIKFSSKKQMNFVKTLTYTVNNQHSHTVTVSAQAVPLDIHLSRNIIEFRFAPDSVTPIIKEFVTVANKSIGQARFNWTGMNSSFSLSATQGVIDPGRVQNIEITYTPTTRPHDEVTLICNVVGGQSRSLKCIGDVGVPKCSVSKRNVNFGLIPIGMTKSQTIKIKNAGDDDAMFTISHQNECELQITPAFGRIAAHEFQNVTVNVKSVHAHSFEVPVSISIAGAQPISFTVSAQSEFPQVVIHNNEFDFGKMYVGSSASLEASISNTGAIPAILFLDLSQHPEFRVEFSSELAEDGDNEHMNSVSLVSDPVFVTKTGTPGMSDSISEVSQEHFDEISSQEGAPAQPTATGLIYKFRLLEGSNIKFNLVFQPTTVMEHSFELPFTMMNVISASSFHLQPIVSAEAVHAPLSISVSTLDFGISPIFDPGNPHSRSVVRQIRLRNDEKAEQKWSLDKSNKLCQDPAVFSCDEYSGIIRACESKMIYVSFTPREATPYCMLLPISVENENGENVIGKVQLTGVGSTDPYSVSQASVALPIVPLNVRSQAKIFIVNHGFIETTIKAKMPVDEQHFPIKVTFPEGNKMEHTTDKLPVTISFCSAKPMSFSTIVAFLDDNGNAASTCVSCTCDNSVFTLYPFFAGKDYPVKGGSGKPLTIECKSRTAITELTNRFTSTEDLLDLAHDHLQNWKPSCSTMHIAFIQRYLNALIMNSQISDFPNGFIRNDMALLLEMISNLTNGKRPNLDLGRDSDGITDPLVKKLAMIKKLIHYLEGQGALLSSVRPEYLLSKPDFIQVMQVKVQKQLVGIDRYGARDINSFDQKALSDFQSSKACADALMQRIRVAENLYNALSVEAWMMVIMQILKIFVMSKIDLERLSRTPGVQNAIKNVQAIASRFTGVDDLVNEIIRSSKSIQSSSIFSVPEGAILKWISIHHASTANDIQSCMRSFTDLQDSIAIASLVKAHVKGFNAFLNERPSDHAQREHNAIELINALKQLKLGFSPRAEEIVDGNQSMVALVAAYMFETLPHFLPSMIVEFDIDLHKTMQRTISLSNPSKAELKYTADLENGANYSLIRDSIILAPGQSGDFPIQFTARTIKSAVGRLTLTPSRPRFTWSQDSAEVTRMPVYCSPVVVDLVSTVHLSSADEQYNMEGPIYNNTKLEIMLKNHIGIPSKARLISKVTMIVDENGRKLREKQTVAEQMQEMINSPIPESLDFQANDCFESLVKGHKVFLFDKKTIEFEDAESEVPLLVEFVPITLGEFRCLMLFIDENNGEFFVQINAKSQLPAAMEISSNKLKSESGLSVDYSLNIESMNSNLIKALAYSAEREASYGTVASERKFKDMLTRRQHEYEVTYKQKFEEMKFNVENSAPQFFTIPREMTLYKQGAGTGKTVKSNTLVIRFTPSKAGEYPCRIVMTSKFDVRVIALKGIGLTATKQLELKLNTVCGNSVKQEIPLHNGSHDHAWTYKITITGDSCFTAPSKITVQPGSFGHLPVTFAPQKIGQFSAEMVIFNSSKECTLVYQLQGDADEPLAEEKRIVTCQARKKETLVLPIKNSIIKNCTADVTSTIPIITFPKEVKFDNGKPIQPFEYTVYAPRSGVAAGTITFTDPNTKNYIWYVLEIHVDSPEPEQTIEVSTIARMCITVSIPIANPKETEANFTVSLSDEDLFGAKTFRVPPKSTENYEIVVSPLKAMKRTSSVSFYSDDDGEFWYGIKLDVAEAAPSIIAPVTSPLGKFASTYISIENPLNKVVSLRVENDNMTAFHVISKKTIPLGPLEKKRIEVRYIPTCLGQKEIATISLISAEMGDWTFKVSGTGKPPQPLSPILVSSSVMATNSALVLFTNPFPYPSRFSMSMICEEGESIFSFLVRRKVFTLNNFGEEFQIPFTFSPKKLGQFSASIIVASLGPARGPLPELNTMPGVTWVFPIIGSSLADGATDIKVIKCRAHETTEQQLTFPLIGEKEAFSANEYGVSVAVPSGYEFVNGILSALPSKVSRNQSATELTVTVTFSPKRPLTISSPITIRNPMGQEWQFPVEISVDRSRSMSKIVIESLLNKTGSARVSVPNVFKSTVPFHAYFVQGSASEFTVSPEHGFIEPTLQIDAPLELPATVVFAPKMYGKVLKGLLVIDTLETQYLFDVVGKTPDYVPPVIADGTSVKRLDNVLTAEDRRRMTPKKRNIIRENIDNAKIAKPQVPTHAKK